MNEAIQGPDAVVRLRIQGPPTPSHFTHVASTIRAVDGVQAVYADHRAGIAWALLHTSATSSHAICQRLKAVSIAATASTFRPAAFVEDHQAFGAFVGQQSRSIIYVLAWSAGVVAAGPDRNDLRLVRRNRWTLPAYCRHGVACRAGDVQALPRDHRRQL